MLIASFNLEDKENKICRVVPWKVLWFHFDVPPLMPPFQVIIKGYNSGAGQWKRCAWSKVCAQCLEMPKLKLSEFGVRKGLLIKKAPTHKMGALVSPQIHLKKVQILGFFYVKRR